MTAWSDQEVRSTLVDIYHQVIARIDAGHALMRALQAIPMAPDGPIHLLAVGKAAPAMVEAAVSWLGQRGAVPAGALAIAPRGLPPTSGIRTVVGDHPLPGTDSRHAADAVAGFVDRVAPGDTLWLLLSGGASSLMASPVAGISLADLTELFDLLHTAGLDIHAMNRVRKRFLAWGAGRLAATIAPARCHAFLVSDVPGDVVASIGSGPVSPDEATVADVKDILEGADLLDRLPDTVQANIAGIEAGQVAETPKPGNRMFDRVAVTIVASNQDAVIAAAEYGRARGWTVHAGAFQTGEASEVGRALGGSLIAAAVVPRDHASLYVWGGETVVTFDSPPTALGGRCQELALAAAQALSAVDGTTLGFLAAGTDGRDGPTDAAGAIVTAASWHVMEMAGAEPDRALSGHASHEALTVGDAVFAPGLTGTNVMDILVGIVPPCGQGRTPATG